MEIDELKSEMKRLGWSVETLAKYSGVPARTIYRITRGTVRRPQAETMKDLAMAVKSGRPQEVKARDALSPKQIHAATFQATDVRRWFEILPGTEQAMLLMELMFAAGEDIRARALEAARNLENLSLRWQREAEEQKRSGERGADR